MTRPAPPAGPAFRPDIEGLRGLAVALVVLFHAGFLGVTGGFIGVDVFFVISGFLITGLLVREREANGRIRLLAFYARRVRRLAPAGLLALVATLATSWYVLDPLSRGETALDGAAAALSIANVRFALSASDYFAPAGAPSPFLHFWSLAVEEQFYLLWPIVIAGSAAVGGAAIAGAATVARIRLTASLAIGTILVASLAASVLVTDVAPGWAFYSLPTRAWQLAAGGLLAVVAPLVGRIPWPIAAPLGWLGLVLVAVAARFDSGLAYPGGAALVPTLGAVALIAGGDRRFGPGVLLTLAPLQFLGRISYSLYLWHWPLLVLPLAAMGSGGIGLEGGATEPATLPLAARLGLVGLAVLVATASCLLVEEPFRRRVSLPAPRTIGAGLAGITAVAVVATSLSVASVRQLDVLSSSPAVAIADLPQPTATPDSDGVGAGRSEPAARPTSPVALPPDTPDLVPRTAASAPTTTEAATSAPATSAPTASAPTAPSPPRSEAPTVEPTLAPLPARKPSGPGLPPDLRPALRDVRTDEEPLRRDRCLAFEAAIEPPDCVYGNPEASFTVALVGDSHGSHLFPALEYVAQVRDWRVVPLLKVSCPFADVRVKSLQLKREYTECAAFREATIERLEQVRPHLTVVAMSHWIFSLDPAHDNPHHEGQAIGRALARVPGRTVLVADTPHAAEDSATCLARNPADISACATPRWQALSEHAVRERIAADAAGVPLIDLADQICVGDPCAAVVDGMAVYRDAHHLTATYARSLGPALERLLLPHLP